MSIITCIQGSAIYIPGDDIDTDRIVPARFLKEISFENMGEYLFYDVRFNEDGSPKDHVLNHPDTQHAKILIVDSNFGCGSSREHAPQALKRFGFEAIIGISFSEIFAGNCKAIGIPVLRTTATAIQKMNTQLQHNTRTQFSIDLATRHVRFFEESILFEISSAHQESFLSGTWDSLGILKQNTALIQDKVATLPYLNF